MLDTQKNKNKNDGHSAAPLGKNSNGKLEGMGKDIAGGALNYKATPGTEKKVGK